MARLDGQVAIVTGGGRGIGRAIALAMSEAGASVCVIARTQTEIDETVSLIEAQHGTGLSLQADVTDAEALKEAVAATERAFGPVDVLVNNAGGGGPLGLSWEVDLEEWRRCIELNLIGPMLGARAVLPGMVSRGRGRIINVATGQAVRPVIYASAYGAAKTALLRLTESLAGEVREHGVSVFAISPGAVRTERTVARLNSEEGLRWNPEGASRLINNSFPPEAAANLCVKLASGVVDSLTGRYFHVSDNIEKIAAQAAEIQKSDLYYLRLETLPRE